MDVIKTAKDRLRKYPKFLSQCGTESMQYAQCVLKNEDELKKNICAAEFDKLKQCLRNAAMKGGTRL
ncbi:unnamed protein product [Bemisia tabaci]|uniref:IMS import disulfide relay-system CHCH-CHCH-like Cx9C domain-containing protein n=1 Tax=Bemisia tabaci TaxID=7038 RepID=A0A9P0A2A1_BEMTA|nr:PREDICTED: uncharacterized protein LOC109031662 [Bemisia tabaci]CAH0382529.1 unnamed protein product [Bemisia tabaci]